MMREIKFRGISADTGKWIYGSYISDIKSIIPFDSNPMYFESVISETVGQYIGLKDKGGREIYEGDIIELNKIAFANIYKSNTYLYTNKGVIYYNDDAAVFVILMDNDITKQFLFGIDIIPEDVKVIGNIYENTELLES